MNRDMNSASSGKVLLLVTKKFAQRENLYSSIRSKLFGTPTTAEKEMVRLLYLLVYTFYLSKVSHLLSASEFQSSANDFSLRTIKSFVF